MMDITVITTYIFPSLLKVSAICGSTVASCAIPKNGINKLASINIILFFIFFMS